MVVNNTTVVSYSSAVNAVSLAQNITYVLLAAPSLVVNLLLSTVILKTKSLRRRSDVLIYCGLLVADAVLAFGLLCQGIKRSWWNLHGPLPKVAAWYCMTSVPETPIVLGRFLVAFMFLTMSVDRLYSVISGNRYKENSKLYAGLQICIPYAFSLFAVSLGWYLSSEMSDTPVTTPMCVIDYAYPFAYNVVLYFIEALFGVAGCVNHFLVFLVLRQRSKTAVAETNAAGKANDSNSLALIRARRQSKVSRTLALISATTFALCVWPAVMKAVTNVFEISSQFSVTVTPYLGLMTIFSTVLNAALYWAKQIDVKQESLKLLRKLKGNSQVSSADVPHSSCRNSPKVVRLQPGTHNPMKELRTANRSPNQAVVSKL